MKNLIVKIKTARLIGFNPIFRVLAYRLKSKLGWHALYFRNVSVLPSGPFFYEQTVPCNHSFKAVQGWKNDSPPDWHINPQIGKRADASKAWWKLSDFDGELGDIKCVWEASRFDWILALSERYVLGDAEALIRINQWLSDWCEKNPAYQGVNWKCGQEAAIRVLHLSMAALLLGQAHHSSDNLLQLISAHVKRILPTLQYAMSQDNNHGTSEASALFVAGSWLVRCGISEGVRWEKLGRKWLENRVKKLVGSDGSFSQYSVNYHRLFLDTLCMVELWRRALDLPCFSEGFERKVKSATHWLFAMVDRKTGDAPNLGAHDGALLLPLVDCDSRDFRPSVQTAMVLFEGACVYKNDGHWNAVLAWFDIALPKRVIENGGSQLFDEGGLAVLRTSEVMALLRYPRFRFRPSQADALHVDLWRKGSNLLRDAGTYGYHVSSEWEDYFSGTKGHNTIQFDDRDQMPRLGRFLFGNWLKTEAIEPIRMSHEGVSFSASYYDDQRCYHKRCVLLSEKNLTVVDAVRGFNQKAILRWRLSPGEWHLEGSIVKGSKGSLIISADVPIARINLVMGFESRYYLQKTEVPVLEVEIKHPGKLFSQYEWT